MEVLGFNWHTMLTNVIPHYDVVESRVSCNGANNKDPVRKEGIEWDHIQERHIGTVNPICMQ